MEEIARTAGFTTGALYSNFAGKNDLFLALLDDTTRRHVALYEELMASAGEPGEGTRATTHAFLEFLEREPESWALFMEFWVHSVRDPELRRRLAPGHAALRHAIAHMLERTAKNQGGELPPSEAAFLATVIQALGSGLALIKLLDPADVPDDMFGAALRMLFAGAEADGGSGRQRR